MLGPNSIWRKMQHLKKKIKKPIYVAEFREGWANVSGPTEQGL